MLVVILTNTRAAAHRMSVTDIAALLRQASTSEYALDSSKLRSGATRRVETEGLVKIEKYHQAVAYLISPALVEELVEASATRARLERDLPVAAHLLSAALKLGIAPELAVHALVTDLGEGRSQLNVAALAGMLESAADDLDAAAVARERLPLRRRATSPSRSSPPTSASTTSGPRLPTGSLARSLRPRERIHPSSRHRRSPGRHPRSAGCGRAAGRDRGASGNREQP